MTTDADGYAIIALQDIRNGGNNNVVAYKIAPDGTFAWGDDGISLSNSVFMDVSPKVVITNAGNIVFAWQAEDVIIRQKLDPAGTLLWGPDGKTLAGTDTYSWPQLLPVGTDEVFMKYFHDIPQGPNLIRHAYAQKYDANGDEVWANPVTISNAGGIMIWSGQIFPFISDGGDGFYIAWDDDRDSDLKHSVFVQHVSSSGETVFANNGLEVCTTAERAQMYPVLGLPPGSSDIFVFWSEMNAGQTLQGIFGQKINAFGALQWSTAGKMFLNLGSNTLKPCSAGNSFEDMVVFYEQYTSDVNSELKAMRIDTDGNFVWTTLYKTISSVDSKKGEINTGDFINNQWILSWDDNRNGNKDIYAQNIQLDGSLGPYYPQPGSISGVVSFINETADPTLTTITAGDESVNASADGSYLININPGIYTVTATHPYCICDSTEDVLVFDGLVTENIDFTLEVVKADIICKAYDNQGIIHNDVDLEIYGPSDTLYGTITNDSAIFECVPYGFYEGLATIYSLYPSWADTTIDKNNHHLIFTITMVDVKENEDAELLIFPNPATDRINIEASEMIKSVQVYNPSGQMVMDHTGGTDILNLNTASLEPGLYLFRISTKDRSVVRSLVIK
jgi:hypothetical protein